MSRTERVTISDIARLAGVSKSTVSRVFTESSPVKEDVKKRVLKIVEEMQYYPNLAARNLSSKKSGAVGVILNLDPDYHFKDYVSMETLRGLSVTATSLGMRLLIINGGLADTLPRLVSERSVDGLIVMGIKIKEKALIGRKGLYNIPVLLLNYKKEYDEYPSVSFAHEQNANFMAKYIIKRGHRKIGFIECSPDLLYVQNRRKGYLKALDEAGIEQNKEWVFEVKDMNEVTAGKVAANSFLELKEKPTVIVASSDNLAIAFMGRLSAAGVKIPDDVSVVGVDDLLISRYVHPSLTTVLLDGFSRGKIACESIHKLISGEKLENKHFLISSPIVERESLRDLRY